ncbi:MAG: hypothetical protein J2P49_01965 [Methylocapsa sp.]|nr:hypothetical protein [Methylocapsa sp.]
MHRQLSLIAAIAAFTCAPASSFAQQAARQAPGGGIAGTAIGGVTGRQIPLALGTGHIGAGTGGGGRGVGNTTGGTAPSRIAGSGGIADGSSLASGTGGIMGNGRGINPGSGGIADLGSAGGNTGGIAGSQLGAGTGGIGNLTSLGADTGGIAEGGNAPRFEPAH